MGADLLGSSSGEQSLFGGNIDNSVLHLETQKTAMNNSNELNQYSENGEWATRNMFLDDKAGNTRRFTRKTWRH